MENVRTTKTEFLKKARIKPVEINFVFLSVSVSPW